MIVWYATTSPRGMLFLPRRTLILSFLSDLPNHVSCVTYPQLYSVFQIPPGFSRFVLSCS